MYSSVCENANVQRVKVSILVPCCNVEAFLPQCLDSIVNQTLKNVEIICINDGSKDNTLAIIKRYAKNDKRIRIIDKPNSGYGDSMNKGLDLATGEYIGIVESDDFVEPNMFQILYAEAKKFDADIVKSNFWLYWSQGNINEFYECFTKEECNSVIVPSEYKDGTLYRVKPSIWSAIYKHSFLKENRISFLATPGASYQDTSFTFKAFSACKKFVGVYDAFLHYRQDNAGSSVNNADKKANFVCEEYREIDKYIQNSEAKDSLYPIYAAAFYDACIWMYERLSIVNRYEFLKTISPLFKKIIGNIGVDKIYFNNEWWKRRDIQRIANDPFEYHMWRNVERYEQSGSKFVYKEPVTRINNFETVKKERSIEHAKTSTPFITIIIPVYNCEKYLRSCLESLLFQTDKDFEVICVNDGSTDHSLSILEEYASLFKRLIIINKENGGPSVARNMGIKLAKGKFIAFLDSDDYYAENSISKLKEVALKNKEVDGIVFGTNIFPTDPKASDWHYNVLTTPDKYFDRIDQKTLLTTAYLKVYAWRFCYRRNYLKTHGLMFPEKYKYGEDAIFTLMTLPKMHGLVAIPDKLYNYRHYRPDSLMNQINRDYIKYTEEQLRALKEIIHVSIKNFHFTSLELFEYACDFIYSCISNCPEPERTDYIHKFVAVIKHNKLDKYAKRASENCKGFWFYCVNLVKEVNAAKRKRLPIKSVISKLVPPSRRLFNDRIQGLENLLNEQRNKTEELSIKLNNLQNICNAQLSIIEKLESHIKKDK